MPKPLANSYVIRRPSVADYFYPSDRTSLEQAVTTLTPSAATPTQALAAIVPHGSFRHAGAVLGAVFGRLQIPRRCVLLGPSHTGSWMPWSLMAGGAYRTPLGDVPVDESCAEALMNRCAFLEHDAWSQRGEHALEVVLPFLQRLGPADLTIVPVIIGSDDEQEFAQLAVALAQVIRMQEEPVLLIASSDLSHYVSRSDGSAQDRRLLDAIATLQGAALIERVRAEPTLMCGYGAVATVIDAARHLGATRTDVVAQQSSADGGGDPHSAIGYAGVLIR